MRTARHFASNAFGEVANAKDQSAATGQLGVDP